MKLPVFSRQNVLRVASLLVLACLLSQAASAQIISSRRDGTGFNGIPKFGFGTTRSVSHSFIPRHQRVSQSQGEVEMLDASPSVYEQVSHGNELVLEQASFDGGCASCGAGVVHGGSCTSCNTGCNTGCLISCPTISFRNMEFFAGVQGVTGSPNQGETGTFGFNGGFNWGFDLPCTPGNPFTAQVGLRSVTGNYSGASFTDASRDQLFLTAGLVRRVDYGLQGGVVMDYVRDDWYYKTDLTQLRGELSWVYPRGNELGFDFASGLRSQTRATYLNAGTSSASFEPKDWYTFFYRCYFSDCNEANVKMRAGWTAQSEGLIGANFWAPLNECLALESSFTFVMPPSDQGNVSSQNEAWNVGLQLVFYPSGHGTYRSRYNRPMFNVADNGTFLYRR